MRKGRLAVHHRSACSGVKALRNTSPARRQAAKLCYRFGPLTPSARSANLIAGDGTKNGPSPLRTRNRQKNQNNHLTGKAPYKSAANLESLDQAVLISGGPQVKRRRVPAPGPDRPHVIASDDRAAAPKSKQSKLRVQPGRRPHPGPFEIGERLIAVVLVRITSTPKFLQSYFRSRPFRTRRQPRRH